LPAFSRLIAGVGASEVSVRGWIQIGAEERYLPRDTSYYSSPEITAKKQMGNN